jgi:hypothetical protein
MQKEADILRQVEAVEKDQHRFEMRLNKSINFKISNGTFKFIKFLYNFFL